MHVWNNIVLETFETPRCIFYSTLAETQTNSVERNVSEPLNGVGHVLLSDLGKDSDSWHKTPIDSEPIFTWNALMTFQSLLPNSTFSAGRDCNPLPAKYSGPSWCFRLSCPQHIERAAIPSCRLRP